MTKSSRYLLLLGVILSLTACKSPAGGAPASDPEPVEVASPARAEPDDSVELDESTEAAAPTPAPDHERIYALVIDQPTTIASGHEVTILSRGHKSIYAGQRGHSMWALTITREGSEPVRVPYGYDSGSPWFIEVMLPEDGLALTLQRMPAKTIEERGQFSSMRELTVSSKPGGVLMASPPPSEEEATQRLTEIANARAIEDGCDATKGPLYASFPTEYGVFTGVYQDGGDSDVRCEVVVGGYSGRVASSKYEEERIQKR